MSSEYERYKEFSKGWDYNKMATNYDEVNREPIFCVYLFYVLNN